MIHVWDKAIDVSEEEEEVTDYKGFRDRKRYDDIRSLHYLPSPDIGRFHT